MATLAATRRARSLLLIHQSSLRSRLLPHRRTFHASLQPRFLDTCFEIAHTALTGVHSFTGLPWVATIPCFAFVARMFILSPVTIYLHRLNSRRATLKPALLAWVHVIRIKVQQEHGAKGPDFCHKELAKQHARKSNEINRRHGTQLSRNLLSLVQLPFFLIIVETLRKMCGANKGLLGLVTDRGSQDYQSIIEAIPLEQLIAPDLGNDLLPFEESFGSEGALWFPDLLVPDPMMILPFTLSACLFLNIYYQTSRYEGMSESKWMRRLSSSLKVLALASGPMTLQVPSAMLLYWISSSLFGLGQLVLMQRLSPRKKPPQPCMAREQRLLLGASPSK